jgi:hypothetical protein
MSRHLLHNNLHYHFYKIQTIEEMWDCNFARRRVLQHDGSKPELWRQKRCPLICNGSVNMSPWQRTCYYTRAAGSSVFCRVCPEAIYREPKPSWEGEDTIEVWRDARQSPASEDRNQWTQKLRNLQCWKPFLYKA